jgi:glycosyltransferase involved in cell wall biosynthesis
MKPVPPLGTLPLVTVIIPNYNYGRFIEKCIDSVIEQTYPNIEIIVVDDGSTDNSVEILETFTNQITLIKTKNNGSIVARNYGLLHANGEYICYLDSDDYMLPSRILRHLEFMISEGINISFCDTFLEYEDNLLKKNSVNTERVISLDSFLDYPSSTFVIPSAVLMRRELVNFVGIWDSALKSPAEDFDYFRRCARVSPIFFYDEALVVHREHESSLTSTIDLDQHFEDNIKAVKKMFLDLPPNSSLVKKKKSWITINLSYFNAGMRRKKIKVVVKSVKNLIGTIFL